MAPIDVYKRQETIRKDMIYLEENGIAKKGYGGAVVATELMEPSFLEKSVKHQDKKAAIAGKAAELVADGSTVLLDNGSTVLAIAKQLILKKDITVFTNSIKVAQVLIDSGAVSYTHLDVYKRQVWFARPSAH